MCYLLIVKVIVEHTNSFITFLSGLCVGPSEAFTEIGVTHKHSNTHTHTHTHTHNIMQSEKHIIQLDSENNVYMSGTSIHGAIQLLCTNKGKKIRGVCMRIVGRGKCGWTTLQQQRSPVQQSLPNDEVTAAATAAAGAVDAPPAATATTTANAAAPESSTTAAAAAAAADKKTELALQYTGKEVYVDETVFLVGSKTAPSFTVYPHNNTFEFTYALPANLPSTIKGQYGKIKYHLEFTAYLPWRFDETYTVPLYVQHSLDLRADPAALLPYQRQQTRNVGLLNSGPISLHVYAPRGGCAAGDRLPIQVIVTNRSGTHVDKVKFTLVQLLEYHSTSPARFMRTECVRVVRKEAGGVDKRSEQKYEHLLEIPSGLQATRTGCGIINVRYEIQVEAKLTGLFRNLMQTVPFVVASAPLEEDDTPTEATAATAAAAAEGTPQRAPALGWQPPMGMMSASMNDAAYAASPFMWTPPTTPPRPAVLPPPPAQHPMSTSMNDAYAAAPYMWTPPTASAYPSLQSLPASVQQHQEPPNYAQSTVGPAYPPALQRGSVGGGSMRSDRYGASPSAPPLEFGTPSGSTRSSVCGSVQQMWTAAPPSYDQVYGGATSSPSSSASSSPAPVPVPFSGGGQARRHKQPPYPV